MISGGYDQNLKLWDLSCGMQLFDCNLQNKIHGVSISQNEKLVVAYCENGTAFLFDCEQKDKMNELVRWRADTYLNDALFTLNSKYILTSLNVIKLWSVSKLLSKLEVAAPIMVIDGNLTRLRSSLLMMNSCFISYEKKLQMWNSRNRKLIKAIQLSGYDRFNPNKNIVVSQDLTYMVQGHGNVLQVYRGLLH